MIGILKQLSNLKEKITLKFKMILLIITLISIFLIIPPIFLNNFSKNLDFWSSLFNILYITGDILLIISCVLIIIILKNYQKGKIFISWLTFMFAPFFMLIANFIFAIFAERYVPGILCYAVMDIIWIIGFLFYSYSLFHIAITTKETREKFLKN